MIIIKVRLPYDAEVFTNYKKQAQLVKGRIKRVYTKHPDNGHYMSGGRQDLGSRIVETEFQDFQDTLFYEEFARKLQGQIIEWEDVDEPRYRAVMD